MVGRPRSKASTRLRTAWNISDDRTEDPAVYRFDQGGEAVGLPSERDLDRCGFAIEPAGLDHSTYHVDMGERAAVVLAAFNGINMSTIKADQDDRTARLLISCPDRDPRTALFDRQCYRQRRF